MLIGVDWGGTKIEVVVLVKVAVQLGSMGNLLKQIYKKFWRGQFALFTMPIVLHHRRQQMVRGRVTKLSLV